jgi:ubiquinone/menaquinone biosynthesis C-methylase UbiE
MTLTDRQQREVDYHKQFASQHSDRAKLPVATDVATSPQRRWWNAYWHTYTLLQRQSLRGKRALVPGCGFGEDAVRLAMLGAEVHACDLSEEVIEIARQRCQHFGYRDVHFGASALESLPYPDSHFDLVLLIDILHHVDIERAVVELARVLRPGGVIIGDEVYTHSALERVRKSSLIERVVYPRMVRYIYGGEPYITEDEHKIDEQEFAIIRRRLRNPRITYFNAFIGRVVRDGVVLAAKLDRAITRATGNAAAYLGGRVVFEGEIIK